MDDRNAKIANLKNYFARRNDVAMAFLFGSQAKESGMTHAHSDWDIGVYFKPQGRELEYEDADREYPAEEVVTADIVNLLETDDVDIVVLNRAPAVIADAALRGETLSLKDHSLWLSFMLVVSRIAEDFRQFSHRYYEIAQRYARCQAAAHKRLYPDQ
jgi:predicted nucleotidyltransferase